MMTKDWIIAGILFVFLIGLGFVFRLRDSRRVKSRTLEALSSSLRKEIEEERRLARERQEKFETFLKKAGNP